MDSQNCIWGCGLNDFHQLGVDKISYSVRRNQKVSLAEVPVPMKLSTLNGVEVIKISCGANHSVVFGKVQGRFALISFGLQKHSQLGVGKLAKSSFQPRVIRELNDCVVYQVRKFMLKTPILQKLNKISVISLTFHLLIFAEFVPFFFQLNQFLINASEVLKKSFLANSLLDGVWSLPLCDFYRGDPVQLQTLPAGETQESAREDSPRAPGTG